MAKYKSRTEKIIQNIENYTLQFHNMSNYKDNCWYIGLIDTNNIPDGFKHHYMRCWTHERAQEVLDFLIQKNRFCQIKQEYNENQNAVYFFYGVIN